MTFWDWTNCIQAGGLVKSLRDGEDLYSLRNNGMLNFGQAASPVLTTHFLATSSPPVA